MDNDKVMKYKDALVEVEAALNCLELEAFNKIPKELISAIEKTGIQIMNIVMMKI